MARVPDGAYSPVRLPLTEAQALVVERLTLIAKEGREATQDEIVEAFGGNRPQSAPMIISRVVAKGYLEHVAGYPLQRGIWIRIVDSGLETKAPKCLTPHWRYRKDGVPTPTIQRVAEYAKPLAQMIETKAKSLGKPLAEFLMDCVYVGFHEICRDCEQ